MNPQDKRPKRPAFRRHSVRQSVRDEFAFHLEMTVAELVEQGMTPAAAEREARRRFGRLEEYRRDCHQISRRDRSNRRWRESMKDFGMDLRFAARRLARSPLFAAVALLTLALGIGANTAMFTLVNGVILQPLPYQQPEELVSVAMQRTDGAETDAFSYPDFVELRAQSETLAEIGFWTWWTMDITDAEEPTSVPSVRVSTDMLSVIGAEPATGRLFRPEEGEEGGDNVAILSHALWQSHYGGEPLVGSDIEIDGEPHTVVGIMPPGFRFPYVQDYGAGFWVPLPMNAEEESRSGRWLNAVGRLAPGATAEQARIEIETIAARLAAAYPASNAGWTMSVTPMHESVVGDGTRSALWTLYGVVAFVLLIACANLANLLLARMESRQHEIAVRAALGAGRGRLLRELLAETILIGAAGGGLGILMAWQGMQLFISWVPEGVPRLDEIGFDGTVLGFAIAATAGTCALFGLLPAMQASAADLQSTIKTASTHGASRRQRFRSALVVVEIAVALVLLTGAGLLLRSFGNLLDEEIGFDPSRIVTFQLSPGYEEPAQRIAFFRQVVERLRSMPGVESVGANTAPPLSGVEWSMAYTVDGEPLPGPGEETSAEFNVVSPDYFRTLSIELRAGRFSSEQDDADSGRVLLVNETFARRHWPEGNAVGRTISIGARDGDDDTGAGARPRFEIIGVVADTRKLGVDREPPAEMYLPYTLSAQYFMSFVVRTAGEPAALIDSIRSRVWELDDSVAIEDMATLSSLLYQSVAEPRFNAMLVGGFAALAVVLAVLGIYGVVAYSASRRRREIGVRVALGADKEDVFRLLLGQGLALTAAGIGLGLIVALAVSRILSSMVYGVATTDPPTFAGVALLLATAALSAAYLPARRAARIDPLVALRDDR